MRINLLRLTVCAGGISSILIFLAAGGNVPLQEAVRWTSDKVQTASVFFATSITVDQIRNDYNGVAPSPVTPQKKVRILIVPGHRPDEGARNLMAYGKETSS